MAKINPKKYNYIDGQLVDAEKVKLPDERKFRNAWTHDTDVIYVDMTKALEIQKNYIRQERSEAFSKLDSEWFIADEQGNKAKKDEIRQKKQALRDITKHPRLLNASNPEELAKLDLKSLLEN